MTKDKLAGKKTGLPEQGALAGIQEKKGEFVMSGRRGRLLRRTAKMP